MFSALKERFGTAGLVVAIVALIVVLGGTAFAAGGGLTGKQKKEVKKIAKSFQGTGPAGPQGAPGAPGANGKDGANGQNGAPGAPGAPGKSVVSEEEEPGANCEEGGYSFEVEDSEEVNYVCNGLGTGAASQTQLAPGETETGMWGLMGTGEPNYLVTMNFPLRPVFDSSVEIIGNASNDPDHCSGTVQDPQAAPGYLCMYREVYENLIRTFLYLDNELEPSGLNQEFAAVDPTEPVVARGSWAVTSDLSGP